MRPPVPSKNGILAVSASLNARLDATEFHQRDDRQANGEIEHHAKPDQLKLPRRERPIFCRNSTSQPTKWPDAERVQALLREHAMRMVVDPGAHSHDDQLEVTAEIRSVTEITSLTAKLPEQLAPILVVSYRPSQIWVREKAAAPLISF